VLLGPHGYAPDFLTPAPRTGRPTLAAGDGYDYLETGASMTAHGFYQRLGYVDVRTIETDFGVNHILRKPLRGAAP
jgi:hypothetical protein